MFAGINLIYAVVAIYINAHSYFSENLCGIGVLEDCRFL